MTTPSGPRRRYLTPALAVLSAAVTIRFPAGVLVFYITFNLWTVLEQSALKQLIANQRGPRSEEAFSIEGDEDSVDT